MNNTSALDAALAHDRTERLDWWVLLFLIGMVAVWTILTAVSHRAPDLDGMEELVWAASLELGYTKHPPAPSWVMHFLTQIFGRPVWLSFFAGQLSAAVGLWFIWLLAREITTPRKAFTVILLLSATAYFSLRATIYNHNTAQLWPLAAATWLFYRALRYQSVGAWLWLGAVSALATMTKYSAFIQFAAFFCFMLRQGSLRDVRTLKGLAYALAAYAVVVSPHVYWLVQHAFKPLQYADRSLQAGSHLQALLDAASFTVDQAARLSPMAAVLLAWTYWNKKSNAASTSASPYAAGLSAWDRSFLLWVGLTPVVSTLLISALLGTQLIASWGTTFFILYGFYALWWIAGDERANLRRIAVLVIAVQLLMAVGYAIGRGPLAWHTGRTSRSTFPGPDIASEINAIWRKHEPNRSLKLVAATTWMGGNIAIHTGPDTQVLIDGDYEQSPWLNPATALDCGAMVVYSPYKRPETPAGLVRLFDQSTVRGQFQVRWSSEKSPLIGVDWGLIPPTADCK